MTGLNERIKALESKYPEDELDQIAMRDAVFGISEVELGLLEQAKRTYDEYDESAYTDLISKSPFSDMMGKLQLLYKKSLEARC